MMAVAVNAADSAFTAGTPRLLFDGPFASASATVRGYDVTPDGQQFLLVQPIDRAAQRSTQMVLVQNWVEDLKRLVPAD